jgi:hypothetical protein
LVQLSARVPGIRPALFDRNTAAQLDEFRRFRHIARHVYSFDYDWTQMSKLLAHAGPLLARLIDDAKAFRAFLISVIAQDSK